MKSFNSRLFALIILMFPFSLYGQWVVSSSTDEMTGKKSFYATSSITSPNRAMNFPYNDVKAWIGIGYNGENEWVYIGFTKRPNLTNTDTKDGYDLIKTRIKWDNSIETVSFTQRWGDKFIHFVDGEAAIEKIFKYGKVLIELPWYGEGSVYFEFSLRGSSSAIVKMRNSL